MSREVMQRALEALEAAPLSWQAPAVMEALRAELAKPDDKRLLAAEREKVKLPFKPDHVTEEDIRKAVEQLPDDKAQPIPCEWRAAVQEFVDRCERGEIRSKHTYAKFKALLKGAAPQPPAEQFVHHELIEPGKEHLFYSAKPAEQGAELPPLPAPDGYIAMTATGSIVVPPVEFKRRNAYAVFTAEQVRQAQRDAIAADRKARGGAA